MPQAPQSPQNAATAKLQSPDASALTDALGVISTGLKPSGISPSDSVQLPAELLPLDFGMAKNPNFDLDKAGERSNAFQGWQFETLLDQSADLLERSLRDRAAYDGLRAQWLKLKLDVYEFERLREVHELEIEAGLYQVDAAQSQADADAEQKAQAALNPALQKINDFLQNNFNISDLGERAAVLAKLSLFSSYAGQHRAGMVSGEPGNPGETKFNVNADTQLNGEPLPNSTYKSVMVSDLVLKQTIRSLSQDLATLTAQLQSIQAQLDGSKARAVGRDARATWDGKNEDFRRKRDQIAVILNDIKRLAMQADGGAYNLREQMTSIRDRFTRDFRDAYVRLLAAQRGLSDILGYEQAVPKISATGQPYSDCLIWTREAIKQVVAFSHLDQAYILPISVRRLMGDDEWKKAKRDERWMRGAPIMFSFSLGASHFPAQSYVRLRGVSLSVVGDDIQGEYQMVIKPPARAVIYRKDSSSNKVAQKELNQSSVPPLVYGRGRAPNPVREPDVVGATTLRNVSPIGLPSASPSEGSWTLAIQRFSSSGQNAEKIDDIVLNLYVAARTY